jgi:allophanate hydrolase subunit 2
MIRVERAIGLCTIQDLGHHGRMHEAVPPGGALVPDLLVRANRRAHNHDAACAIEVLGRISLRAEIDLQCATDERAFALRRGESITIASDIYRATYVAVRGGFDHDAALLCAGGASLRAGDVLRIKTNVASTLAPFSFALGEVGVLEGPDGIPIDALLAHEWRVSNASDRIGTRLDGPIIERPTLTERSRPMTCGAIELPRDGKPIVLGPEHPTTGGYPLIAIIAHAERSRFFAIPLGGVVRFVRR